MGTTFCSSWFSLLCTRSLISSYVYSASIGFWKKQPKGQTVMFYHEGKIAIQDIIIKYVEDDVLGDEGEGRGFQTVFRRTIRLFSRIMLHAVRRSSMENTGFGHADIQYETNFFAALETFLT